MAGCFSERLYIDEMFSKREEDIICIRVALQQSLVSIRALDTIKALEMCF
jgi:hypothetical protein